MKANSVAFPLDDSSDDDTTNINHESCSSAWFAGDSETDDEDSRFTVERLMVSGAAAQTRKYLSCTHRRNMRAATTDEQTTNHDARSAASDRAAYSSHLHRSDEVKARKAEEISAKGLYRGE